MSDKEIAIHLLERVPENKLGYVIAYLQGITADEEKDDEFCEKLLEEYENDPEKDEYITIEEMAELCGVELDELKNTHR